MGTDRPMPSERLPTALVEQLDALDVPELRAARAYVDDRIEHCRGPIRERILADATGEVLGIEDYGTYALVRKRAPHPGDSDAETQLVCYYHVRRGNQLHGEETLYWSFVGCVPNLMVSDCDHCGGPVDEQANFCPHCGAELSDASPEESDD